MDPVAGIYQLAECSQSHPASALLYNSGYIQIMRQDGNTGQLRLAHRKDYWFGDVIPGIAIEVIFADGAIFTPSDPNYRWTGLASKKTIPAWLESHWIAVVAATLMVPLFLWMMSAIVIPTAVDATVVLLPDAVDKELGEGLLSTLDQIALKPSQLKTERSTQIRSRWQSALRQLNLPRDKYRLYFRDTDLGANAIALPDGSVIATDDIVELMADKPDAMTAVLLHEIGHVEHRHGIKQLARSIAITVLFAFLFGDIEGIGELILSTGTSLLQSAYARDMEREADNYAHQKLVELGLSPSAFADALRLLTESDRSSPAKQDGENDRQLRHWLDYLSTHPRVKERIEAATEGAV